MGPVTPTVDQLSCGACNTYCRAVVMEPVKLQQGNFHVGPVTPTDRQLSASQVIRILLLLLLVWP